MRAVLRFLYAFSGALGGICLALMLAMIIPTAFFVGGLLNHGLRLIF